MPEISLKSRSFGESVIRRMTRVANEHGAINLSQGFPDFDPPAALLEAAEKVMRSGPHQYAVTWGAPNFREALAAKQTRFMGIPLNPAEHLTVTCGATEAMLAAIMTAVNPGDKVIVFSPFYENYLADAILAGADPVCVPYGRPGRWTAALALTPTSCGRPSNSVPRHLSCATPQTPPARFSPEVNFW